MSLLARTLNLNNQNQLFVIGFLLFAVSMAIAVLSANIALVVLGCSLLAALMVIEPLGGVAVLLLVAPLKALIAAETSYSLPLDVGQLTLGLIIGIWIIHKVSLRQPIKLRFSKLQLPILLFIGMVLIGMPGAVSLNHAITELLKWAEILILVSFCLVLFNTETESHWLVFAIVLAGAVQAAIGLYEFMGGSGVAHLYILDDRFFRAFGTFGQPNPFGAFMGVTLPLAAMTAAGHTITLWKSEAVRSRQLHYLLKSPTRDTLFALLFHLGSSGLLLAALFASWSRGAWLGFIGACALMLFLLPPKWWQRIALTMVIASLGMGVWFGGLLPSALTTRMSSFVGELTSLSDARGIDITDSNYAVSERIAHWQVAIWAAEDSPWTGHGFGNYEVIYADYALMNWPQALGHAHNYYLNLLAEVGIIGLIGYVACWAGIVWLSLRQWWYSTSMARYWSIALIAAWAYITIHSLVDKLYVNNMFLHIGCMLGLLALLMRNNHTIQKVSRD